MEKVIVYQNASGEIITGIVSASVGWKTSDGQEFLTRPEATQHEKELATTACLMDFLRENFIVTREVREVAEKLVANRKPLANILRGRFPKKPQQQVAA